MTWDWRLQNLEHFSQYLPVISQISSLGYWLFCLRDSKFNSSWCHILYMFKVFSNSFYTMHLCSSFKGANHGCSCCFLVVKGICSWSAKQCQGFCHMVYAMVLGHYSLWKSVKCAWDFGSFRLCACAYTIKHSVFSPSFFMSFYKLTTNQ